MLLYLFVGFINLPLCDQMNVLQNTWLDVLCLNLAFRSTPYTGLLVFADDFKVSLTPFPVYQNIFVELLWVKVLWNYCGWNLFTASMTHKNAFFPYESLKIDTKTRAKYGVTCCGGSGFCWTSSADKGGL